MTDRTCGTCTLCCKVVAVTSLGKPAGQWCQHARPGKGCAIYGSHPDDCRSYMCQWLLQPELDASWKPERCGFVISLRPEGNRVTVMVDPSKPDAWRRAPFYPQIKKWAAQMWAKQDGDLFVHIGRRAIAIFPEEDIDIGDVLPGDTLLVGYQMGPHFRRPHVRHTTAAGVQRELLGAAYPRA
jgi:hypothetical protein